MSQIEKPRGFHLGSIIDAIERDGLEQLRERLERKREYDGASRQRDRQHRERALAKRNETRGER